MSSTESEAVDAASVLVVRDGNDGLEVYVVVRSQKSATFPGLLVFPGGMVDAADLDPRVTGRCCDFDVDAAAARHPSLEPRERALAQYIAGLRELFEEAGMLLARRQGEWVRADRHGAELAEARRALHSGGTFSEICERHDLELCPGEMRFFAHWITPVGSPRRFDTRFFLTRCPGGQVASHDRLETSAGEWIRPRAALDRYERGEAQLAPPTFMLLAELAEFADVDSAVSACGDRVIVPILPRPFPCEGSIGFLYPGDVAYEGGDVDGPGPRRRLQTRNGRWLAVAEG